MIQQQDEQLRAELERLQARYDFLLAAVDHLPVHGLRERADQKQDWYDQCQEQRLEAPSKKPQQTGSQKTCRQSYKDILARHIHKGPYKTKVDQRQRHDQSRPGKHHFLDRFLFAGVRAEIAS